MHELNDLSKIILETLTSKHLLFHLIRLLKIHTLLKWIHLKILLTKYLTLQSLTQRKCSLRQLTSQYRQWIHSTEKERGLVILKVKDLGGNTCIWWNLKLSILVILHSLVHTKCSQDVEWMNKKPLPRLCKKWSKLWHDNHRKLHYSCPLPIHT